MRIIAGELGRRTIVAPRGRRTRPTADRVREALFAHLESARLVDGFSGLRILDLFCGSGALALEALSRGARDAVLVDLDVSAAATARANIVALGLDARATILRADATRTIRGVTGPFDVIFADPPYAVSFVEAAREAAALAAGDAWLVYEHGHARTPPPLPGWDPQGMRTYGQTTISLYRPISAPSSVRDRGPRDRCATGRATG